MATPWRHRHHGGCRRAISFPAILLVSAIVITACSDPNNSTTPPRPGPVISLTAEPSSVSVNDSSTLTWLVWDATSCEASGAWSGGKPLSGSEIVGPLTTSSTFMLTCKGAANDVQSSVFKGGLVGAFTLKSDPVPIDVSASEAVTVAVVGSPPLPLPSVSLIADPTTVDMNGASTLSWSSSDATSCDAGGAWSGSKPLAGNQGVGPLVETSTFTLTCTGAGGSTNRPVTVSVLTAPEPPTAPCSASLFSPDLAGQFRSIPATMGALEVAGVACQ